MEDIIKTVNITKRYGNVVAVNNVSLSISKGEIYGFLGLNGAGKTTTIKLLLGMVKSDSGDAYILDTKIRYENSKLWNRVGYLVEMPYSYPELTVYENIKIFCMLRGISDMKVVDTVIERLYLGSYINIKSKNLSLGNSQRLGLAKAFLHNPDVLILDEPSNGLDPAGIVEIRELLKNLSTDNGVTILVSSHNLSEISRFATRIGIIHKGKLIQEIDTDKLESLLYKSLVVDTREKQKTVVCLNNKGIISDINKNGMIEIKDEKCVTNPDEVASLLVHSGYPPLLLKVEHEDLESYFLRVIGESN